MMEITEFANRYCVRRLPRGSNSKLSSGKPIEAFEDVVEGKAGHIGVSFPKSLPDGGIDSGNRLYELNLIAVPRHANRDRLLASRFDLAQDAGFTLKIKNGAESIWYFDPADPVQALAAIKIVGARKKRVRILSQEQRQALRERLAAGRRAVAR